MKISLQRIF